jgi:hypothetical protein
VGEAKNATYNPISTPVSQVKTAKTGQKVAYFFCQADKSYMVNLL